MKDPRIGFRDLEGKHIAPSQTISGNRPDGIEGTIGLGDGYYAILDLGLSDGKRDELLIELKALIASDTKPSK